MVLELGASGEIDLVLKCTFWHFDSLMNNCNKLAFEIAWHTGVTDFGGE